MYSMCIFLYNIYGKHIVVEKFVFLSNLAVQINVGVNFFGEIKMATLTEIMNIKKIKNVYWISV